MRRIAAASLAALLAALTACTTAPPAASPADTGATTASALAVPFAARFADAIAAFEAADAQAMPPACAVLFVGSSSIRFWNTLEQDFPNRTVINRGFGGSTIAEVNHYFDRIVAPYKPSAIVLYAGENDLAAGKAPADAYADFESFMTLKDRKLGSTPVWYIAAKPSKLRFDALAQQTDLNTRIATLANARDDLAYIDVVQPMLKEDGTPKDIYVEDDLHMTPDGYAIWTPIVEAALASGQTAKAPGC